MTFHYKNVDFHCFKNDKFRDYCDIFCYEYILGIIFYFMLIAYQLLL